MMKSFIIILSLLPVFTFANDISYDALNIDEFWNELYVDKYHTLYCAASGSAGQKVDITAIYPYQLIAQAKGCTGSATCAVAMYKTASKDLHNLWPTLRRYNQSRGNLPFKDIDGETPFFNNDGCDFEQDNAGVEPRNWAKGEIARTMLYMFWKYKLPHNGQLSLMVKWANKYKASAEERWRNQQITELQNNNNPFIEDAEMASIYGSLMLN